jgi:pimeloyl-ACP methyl ester carboxylesterase
MTDITIANGNTKLAASVYGSPAADPILFLHGISLSRDTWEEIAQRLSPTYRVWTLDFRGHGHSDRSPPAKTRPATDKDARLIRFIVMISSRRFKLPAHRTLRVSEGVENLLG